MQRLPLLDPVPVAIVVLLVSMVAGRLINERGLRKLTPDQKVELLDGFIAQRKYSLIPLLAILVLAFAAPEAFPYWALLCALIVYVVSVSVFAIRRMRGLGLPVSYIRSYATAQGVQLAAFLFCLAVLQLGAR